MPMVLSHRTPDYARGSARGPASVWGRAVAVEQAHRASVTEQAQIRIVAGESRRRQENPVGGFEQ